VDGDPGLRVLGVVAAAVLDADREREDRHGHQQQHGGARDELPDADPAPQDQERAEGDQRRAARGEDEAEDGACQQREQGGAAGGHPLGDRLRDLVARRL